MSTPLNLNFPQIEIQFMLRDTFSLDSKASQLYPPYSQNGIDTKNLTVLAYLCPSFRFSKSPMQFRTFNAIWRHGGIQMESKSKTALISRFTPFSTYNPFNIIKKSKDFPNFFIDNFFQVIY